MKIFCETNEDRKYSVDRKCQHFRYADSGQYFLPEVKSFKTFCELGSQVRELYAPLAYGSTQYKGR